MAGRVPCDLGECLVALTRRLTDRLGPVIEKLEDELDEIEDRVIEEASPENRRHLGKVRRRAVQLRCYIAPQREVLNQLLGMSARWLDESSSPQRREPMLGENPMTVHARLDHFRQIVTFQIDFPIIRGRGQFLGLPMQFLVQGDERLRQR